MRMIMVVTLVVGLLILVTLVILVSRTQTRRQESTQLQMTQCSVLWLETMLKITLV